VRYSIPCVFFYTLNRRHCRLSSEEFGENIGEFQYHASQQFLNKMHIWSLWSWLPFDLHSSRVQFHKIWLMFPEYTYFPPHYLEIEYCKTWNIYIEMEREVDKLHQWKYNLCSTLFLLLNCYGDNYYNTVKLVLKATLD
jgi:hypothetical protein